MSTRSRTGLRPVRALTRVLAGIALLLAGSGAPGHEGLEAMHAWARATPPFAALGAVYVAVANHGTQPDRLAAVRTLAAKRAEIHAQVHTDGLTQMRRLDGVELAPMTTTALEPGGVHIMLIDLARPLEEGDTFPITLEFDHAAPLEVQVEVRGAGAMGHDHGSMHAPPSPP